MTVLSSSKPFVFTDFSQPSMVTPLQPETSPSIADIKSPLLLAKEAPSTPKNPLDSAGRGKTTHAEIHKYIHTYNLKLYRK